MQDGYDMSGYESMLQRVIDAVICWHEIEATSDEEFVKS